MKSLLLALLLAGGIALAAAQSPKTQKVFTADIDNFWQAYDSVKTTSDTTRQLAFINTYYVAKRSEGLAAFMKARDYSAEGWVELIAKYPKFWASVRPNTLAVKAKTKEIERSVRKFRQLYPALQDAKMYFTIGGLRSGGTVSGKLVLVGTEIAAADAQTEVSEFPNQWLASVFKRQSLNSLVRLNIHEYVHTQQHGWGHSLLAQAVAEGSCDFITELVIRKPLQAPYTIYGRAHEAELRQRFKQDMFADAVGAWLYNGANTEAVADLGYFMGYAISKSYYAKAKDKKQAVKDIIELDYADDNAVESFLRQSGYYPESWDKVALETAFAAKQPVMIQTLPFANGDQAVDATVKEMTVCFDREMNGSGVSFSQGPRGKEYFPLKRPVGFSADRKAYTVLLDLQPNHEYEFVVPNQGFKSKEGYTLRQDYTIKFKTK